MPSLKDRLIHGWNAFTGQDERARRSLLEMTYASRPDRTVISGGNERSIVTSIFNRIAIDVSSVKIRHVRVDDNDHYVDTIYSHMNECFALSANLDQTGKGLIIDLVQSLCDEGCIALVPVETTLNPKVSGSYDILSMRVGKILQWYPEQLKILLYNEKKGKKEEIILPKSVVAVIENPLYSVMNEPSSTYKRLIRKLNLLDAVDEQSGSGKLDIIIQLPYSLKTQARKDMAEERRLQIEAQLKGSKYGIAYIDATEHVTQLNRPVDNNLMKSIEYLTSMLYSQLGITEEIMNGTADEKTMLNYYNRTIEPILDAIVDECTRKFLTKTARTQKQAIKYFRDPFKLIPLSNLAEIADKFTRNEIMSSNEVRSVIGLKPSDDPRADELRNKNLNDPTASETIPYEEEMPPEEETQNIADIPYSEIAGDY